MLITDCGHPRITKISRNKKESRIQDISEIAKNSKIAKSDLSQNYKYLNYWNTQIIRKMQMSPKLENSNFLKICCMGLYMKPLPIIRSWSFLFYADR